MGLQPRKLDNILFVASRSAKTQGLRPLIPEGSNMMCAGLCMPDAPNHLPETIPRIVSGNAF
jgi:hypothetical protein